MFWFSSVLTENKICCSWPFEHQLMSRLGIGTHPMFQSKPGDWERGRERTALVMTLSSNFAMFQKRKNLLTDPCGYQFIPLSMKFDYLSSLTGHQIILFSFFFLFYSNWSIWLTGLLQNESISLALSFIWFLHFLLHLLESQFNLNALLLGNAHNTWACINWSLDILSFPICFTDLFH